MQVSAASVDITPNHEVPLGCGRMDGPEWATDSNLELNLVAFWFGETAPLILVSVDALYPGKLLRSIIEDEAEGVPPENIILGASHTHAAPMLDSTKPRLGVPDSSHMKFVERQLRLAMRRIMDPSHRLDAALYASKGRVDHSVNRRFRKRFFLEWPLRFNVRGMGPNFWGSRDETVTVLRVRDAQKRVIAVVWNYACHPVAFPRGRTVSAHFPGVVRDRLRQEEHDSFPVVFFQGFSGDTRPLYTAEERIPPSPRHLYRRLRFGPSWRPTSDIRYEEWASSLSRAVLVIAGRTHLLETPKTYRTSRVSRSRLDFVSPGGAPVTFQAMMIGNKVGLVAISGEVMSSLARNVRRLMGTSFTMCVGCADDVVGYLPTTKMIREGGYESSGFLEPFSLSEVSPGVETSVNKGIHEAVRALKH